MVNRDVKQWLLQNMSYTNRDYDKIIEELVDLIKRGDSPLSGDWDNISESDPLFLMLHLMAAHKDILNYQIDYSVLEGNMSTARERQSLVRIANSFGYKVQGYRAGYIEFKVPDNRDLAVLPFEDIFYEKTTGAPWTYLGDYITHETYDGGTYIPLYQGTPGQEVEFNSSTIDSLNKTKVITNQPISVNTNGYLAGASRIITRDNDENVTLEFTEVDNILFVRPDDNKNVYEINEDTQTTYYIKFHPEADIDVNKTYIFQYLITSGRQAAEPLILLVDQPSGKFEMTQRQNFQRGSNPARAKDIKDGFKEHYSWLNTLVTLKDYKNHILHTQKVVPGITEVLVLDSSANTSPNTNAEISANVADREIKVCALREEIVSGEGRASITSTDAIKLQEYLQDLAMTSINIVVENDNVVEAINISFNVSGVGSGAQDTIKDILYNYVEDKGIGSFLSSYEAYSLLVTNPTIAKENKNLTVRMLINNTQVESIILDYKTYPAYGGTNFN